VPEGRGAAYVAIWHAGPGKDARRPRAHLETANTPKPWPSTAAALAAKAANRYHRASAAPAARIRCSRPSSNRVRMKLLVTE
jgi:hypothetical protein